MTAAVIELEDISRIFGSGQSQTTALRHVSLRVMPGEFVAIVGPSGSGKSTLLNVLGLLDHATAGRYWLNGVDVGALNERERDRMRNEVLGFVFQDSRMILTDTAAGNASLGLKVRGTPREDRVVRVGAALRRMGLTHRMEEQAVNLSGGERQRVAIARAIATMPSVILADEPTGSLDSENSQRIVDHLRALNDQGATVVIITHDSAVADAADRRVQIVDGAVVGRSPDPRPSTPPVPASDELLDRGRTRHRWGTVLWDEFCDALSSHSSKPGRALLLLIAFMLGTGGLVCSIGISESAAAQVSERLTAASLDEVVVRSASTTAYEEGFYSPDGEAAAAIARLEGVRGVGFVGSVPPAEARITVLPAGAVPSQSTFGGRILVADSGYLDVQEVDVDPSHAPALLTTAWGAAVAVMGAGAADTLGVSPGTQGAQIWVNGAPVDVVGLISDTGRDSTLSEAIILSPAALGSLTPEDLSMVIRTTPGYPAAIAEAVPYAVSPDDPARVRVETVADLRNLRRGVATDLGSSVGMVSTLLLVLASLSSAVAMYLSVQTRSPEIALRRALGASRSSVWRMFTMEGLVIGAAGGVAGAATGITAVVLICMVSGWTPTLSPSVIMLGLLAGSVAGILSATYPAIVAARADPAIAIRG